MPALALVAWGLLLAAWLMGNPPFAAPDEIDHYIRAVGVSDGHLIGGADRRARVGATPIQIAWTAKATRDVSVPTRLNPRLLTCSLADELHSRCPSAVRPNSSPETLLTTTVGNYQPLPYLAPAILLRAGNSPSAALRLGRAAQAVTVLALLGIAALALYDANSGLVSFLGLLLATTPMTLFCSASLNGSGLEIAAAVAFVSCMLRICRSSSAPPRWWLVAALSGSALALSRADGPFWLALALLVWLAWGWPLRDLRQRSFGFGWAGRLCLAVLVLAVALSTVWELTYGSHVPLDTTKLHAGMSAGMRAWWTALPELVGRFGYVDVKLPLVVPLAWFALVLALWASAYAVSERGERRLLSLVLAGGLLGPVVFYALLIRPTGFGLQGRHVLPFLVVIPLVAGEALYRHRDRVAAGRLRLLAGIVPLVVGVLQAAAWCVNARRYASGGYGRTASLRHVTWAPPAGWLPWLFAALLGGLCLGALALGALGRSDRSGEGAGGAVFGRSQRAG